MAIAKIARKGANRPLWSAYARIVRICPHYFGAGGKRPDCGTGILAYRGIGDEEAFQSVRKWNFGGDFWRFFRLYPLILAYFAYFRLAVAGERNLNGAAEV